MMSKFIIISAFFLLPFVTISAFAQYELPKFELPSDYIITFEQDEISEYARESQKIDKNDVLGFLFPLLVILFFIILIGLTVYIFRNPMANQPRTDRDL